MFIKGVKMPQPIFISGVFLEYILPFILVFTLIFAILQKTQMFGEKKKQIDSLIGLVVGLILIAFPFSRDIVVQLMPFLAVSAVILLVFMILYGFIMGKNKEDILGVSWIKWVLVVISVLALITVLLMITGWWDVVYNFFFNRESSSQLWVNVLLFLVLIGAIVAVLLGKGESRGS